MRNDVAMHGYRNPNRKLANIPEGTIRQQLDAYERLPAPVREALRNAAYDHSPHQLLCSAKIMGWDDDEMTAAIARADERKRWHLIKTGCPIPVLDAA